MTHGNSSAAYVEEAVGIGERVRLVLGTLRRKGCMTDKQVARALGFPHKSAVQPRISELLKSGLLEECGSAVDPDTGKKVRVVRVVPREEIQTVFL